MPMHDPDLVVLESDDEGPSNCFATGHANIVNIVPLDIGSFSRSSAPAPAASIAIASKSRQNVSALPRGPLIERLIENRGGPSFMNSNGQRRENGHVSSTTSTTNNVRPPYQLPRHIAQLEMVPIARVNHYNFECSNGFEEGGFDRGLEVQDAKFKCSFNHCNRIIPGNASFVCHLWAHAVDVLPTEPTSTLSRKIVSKFDLNGISVCPQCSHGFNSPYQAQIHYTRCHSRVPQAINSMHCSICEEEVPNLRAHLSNHSEQEAPYVCKVNKCNYRCTMRGSLFEHYVKNHNNTCFLWCPFCTHFEQLTRNQMRSKDTITVKGFVSHIQAHFTSGKSIRCLKCAYTFLNEEKRKEHMKNDHWPLLPQGWEMRRKKQLDFRVRTKGALVMNGKSDTLCPNCRLEGKTTKKCLPCLEASFALTMTYLRPKKADYYVFRKGWDRYQDGRYLLKCGCGYRTRDSTKMARHRHDFCMKDELLELTVEDGKAFILKPTERDEEEDVEEAELFAIAHSGNNRPHSNNRVVRPHSKEIQKIKDELFDIDEEELLETKQALVRARANKASHSIRIYKTLFGVE